MTTPTLDTPHAQPKTTGSKRIQGGLLDPKMLWKALPDALRKLIPRTLWRNPVMFIVEIGAVWSTILAIADPSWFGWLTVVWLWLTVIFANLAEAVAEGRGKAQAESLRRTKTATMARRLVGWTPGAPGREEEVAAPLLQQGDIVVVEAGQTIPGDGDVVEGIASVDESAITGESAPVIRESGCDVNTLLLDKTGTITLGNRQAAAFVPLTGVTPEALADAAQLSSLADETPEGRSIVVFAKQEYGLRARTPGELDKAHWVEFSATTRMSGVDLENGHTLRKGAASSVADWVRTQGGRVSTELGDIVDGISAAGGTPLVVGQVVDGTASVLGVIHLKDVVKQGMRDRFDEMRRMGIRTVMITGDNPLTAKAIADEAGVDDFLAEATPEDKMALIKKEQAGGKLVAMTGDGTNDAPALAQADVGVAMNTGTSAAKEAGNMVDLDSDPTKLIEIVEIGKQLLITRGALTTFSIANDIAKYFAIIPAMFAAVYPGLDTLNIMKLTNPHTAILSAVIFNALIIVALIPLALRGVKFRALGAAAVLRRNLLIYGLGGIIAPFIGIKLIDIVVTALGVH